MYNVRLWKVRGNFSYVQMKDVYNSIFQSDNREKLFAYEYGYYVSFSRHIVCTNKIVDFWYSEFPYGNVFNSHMDSSDARQKNYAPTTHRLIIINMEWPIIRIGLWTSNKSFDSIQSSLLETKRAHHYYCYRMYNIYYWLFKFQSILSL